MLYKELTIHIPSGLKSKGASMLTHVAGHFDSQILIECENTTINATSIRGVLSRGLPEGGTLTVGAAGTDEQAAIDALSRLAETGELPPDML